MLWSFVERLCPGPIVHSQHLPTHVGAVSRSASGPSWIGTGAETRNEVTYEMSRPSIPFAKARLKSNFC